MTLKSGLLTGLNVGLKGSVLTKYGVGYTIPTATPADIAAITGQAAPSLMYRYDEATGVTELVAGVQNLTDQFGPTKEVASATLGVTCVGFTDNDTARVEAPDAVAATAGTGTISIIHIYELTAVPLGNRQILGKKDGSVGYEIFVNTSGHVRAILDSTTAAPVPTVSADHGSSNAETILLKRSETDSEAGLWTRLGSSVLASPGGAMNSTAFFSVGKDARNAAAANHALTMIWIGASGDGFGETERSAIAVAFGLE